MPWRRTHNRHAAQAIILVELIVVLVILAILAAILVPALLGWIDRAREKQYVLQARNVVIAAQTIVDEAYAAGNEDPADYLEEKVTDGTVGKIADVTVSELITDIENDVNTSDHDAYTISSVSSLKFSVSGKSVECNMTNGAWEITKVS